MRKGQKDSLGSTSSSQDMYTQDSSRHTLEEGNEDEPKCGLVPTDYSKRHCFCHFFDEEWNASVEEEDGSV